MEDGCNNLARSSLHDDSNGDDTDIVFRRYKCDVSFLNSVPATFHFRALRSISPPNLPDK